MSAFDIHASTRGSRFIRTFESPKEMTQRSWLITGRTFCNSLVTFGETHNLPLPTGCPKNPPSPIARYRNVFHRPA